MGLMVPFKRAALFLRFGWFVLGGWLVWFSYVFLASWPKTDISPRHPEGQAALRAGLSGKNAAEVWEIREKVSI